MSVMIPGLYGLDSASAFKALSKDPQKYLDRFAKDKSVQKEIEYFDKKAPTFDSVDALLKDRRATQYLLDSFGLGSEIKNLGRIKKVLTQDPTATKSIVNQLADTRFKNMANALRLDVNMNKLKVSISRETLETKYIQNEFEENLGAQDEALRQAAYFARTSGSISDIYSVLGDKILRDVVTSTFNLPKELAIQPVETQAAVIAKRVDITKFAAAASGNKVTSAQLTNAKSDHTILGTNLAISDAAIKQVSTLRDTIAQLANDYNNLAEITDPGGANSATIAAQNVAVPELVRYDQLLTQGNSSIEAVQTQLGQLRNLITSARASGSDIAALQTQFTGIVNDINDTLATGIVNPDGNSENLLQSGSNGSYSIVINDSGKTVTINHFDTADLQSLVTAAKSAFDAVTSNSDNGNLVATESKILNALDKANLVNNTIDADRASYSENISTTRFVASPNTTSLLQGKNSISDNLDRVTQIATLLDQIGDLAAESQALAVGADRSALTTEFNALKVQLQDLIDDGGGGLDNLLNAGSNIDYEIIGGKNLHVKGNYDLSTVLTGVLNGNLDDQSAALALQTAAITGTNTTDRATRELTASNTLFEKTLNNFDLRGKMNLQINQLQDTLTAAVSAAASNNQNLLAADQSDIKVDLGSTGIRLSFKAVSNFGSTMSDAIDAVLTAVSGGNNVDIVSALDDAVALLDNTKSSLSRDNRGAMVEYGKLAGVIDTLDKSNTESATTYKTNAFTEKFLRRYLALNGSNGSSATSNNPLASLFSGTSSTDAMTNIFSLVSKKV